MTITIGNDSCTDANWRGPANGEGPFLSCQASPIAVGLHAAYLAVATQSVNLSARFDFAFESWCPADSFGAVGEFCVECSMGAECLGGLREPFSKEGWWMKMLDNSSEFTPPQLVAREVWPHFIPCEPPHACLGNNTCSEPYDGVRCSTCNASGYYRVSGWCE